LKSASVPVDGGVSLVFGNCGLLGWVCGFSSLVSPIGLNLAFWQIWQLHGSEERCAKEMKSQTKLVVKHYLHCWIWLVKCGSVHKSRLAEWSQWCHSCEDMLLNLLKNLSRNLHIPTLLGTPSTGKTSSGQSFFFWILSMYWYFSAFKQDTTPGTSEEWNKIDVPWKKFIWWNIGTNQLGWTTTLSNSSSVQASQTGILPSGGGLKTSNLPFTTKQVFGSMAQTCSRSKNSNSTT
jgi:hypothetical protein